MSIFSCEMMTLEEDRQIIYFKDGHNYITSYAVTLISLQGKGMLVPYKW